MKSHGSYYRRILSTASGSLLLILAAGTSILAQPAETPTVDFVRDIQPLLKQHCVACHGTKKQESGLRLDAARLAIGGGDSGPAVQPGKSIKSLLVQVLHGEGDVSAMPYEKPPLSKEAIALISRWIDQGAIHPVDEPVAQADRRQSKHWAFQPVLRPATPAVEQLSWIRNGIDAFVLSRLEREGLSPSPEASRASLIRRLHLDLLGTLPSPADVHLFIHDSDPHAYEKLVDRILASPHYGERWGRHWLDLARYADSDGFTIDGARNIWKYRDWVINAFNRDLPFDRFTIEQTAGDLLDSPSMEQLVATGFHRNTLVNQEGGTNDEQFRVEAVVDRVNTTGSVFLGLTVGCAQCHTHKYDPVSQRDFYRLYAIFNNCVDNNDANGSGPIITVPSHFQTTRQAILKDQLAAARVPLKAYDQQLATRQAAWEKQLASGARPTWNTLEPKHWSTVEGAVLTRLEDHSLFVDFSIPANDTYVVTSAIASSGITAFRIEALTHDGLPKRGPGRASNGNFVLSEVTAFISPLEDPTSLSKPATDPVKIAQAVADHSQAGYPVAHAIDGKQNTGWAINVKAGSLNVDRQAIFILEKPVQHAQGSRLTLKMLQNNSAKNYLLGRFRISITNSPAEIMAVTDPIRQIASKPAGERTKQEVTLIQNAFRNADRGREALAREVTRLTRELETLNKSIPRTMVLRELAKPRQTHIQLRGNFLDKGALVSPGVPQVLPPLVRADRPPNRLDFARWLVKSDNPLTARVTVNRFWQRFFGLGIVETENDFGVQGIAPEHPELLDWLASEFMHGDWGMKAIHRLMVTSATYRQDSRVRGQLLKRDPRNKLLARQSRVRLEAETIRDICLSASELLTPRIGGPGVYPPQPAGIYALTQTKKSWPESRGSDRYRRGLYIYFWRSSPYPFLPTFDAPDATTSCSRRSRSNTPLQALTLANDRVFLEMAQGLAAKILQLGTADDQARVRYAFTTCFARQPTDREIQHLIDFVHRQREHYRGAEQDALLIAPSHLPKGVSPADGAAWTAASRVLLNLDEFITRE
jgi:mono/diheme cytochrome c family protein